MRKKRRYVVNCPECKYRFASTKNAKCPHCSHFFKIKEEDIQFSFDLETIREKLKENKKVVNSIGNRYVDVGGSFYEIGEIAFLSLLSP
jgi:predicted ATP-dependent serine protease